MLAIALKTELDVAALLLDKGWLPEEINDILAFPLPETVFHSLLSQTPAATQGRVTKVTSATPTTLHRARQLLQNAGWLEPELNSLLKPHLYRPWRHTTVSRLSQQAVAPWHWLPSVSQTIAMPKYRRIMALKRISSLGLVIAGVCTAVMLAG